MRRGVGVSAVRKKRETKERYANLADQLEATQEQHVAQVLASFRSSLEEFARKHKKKIRSDPVFRSRFTEMCYEIGVDPLRSSKGFWTEVLGVGDFYYELGIKIIEACQATKKADGGLVSLEELAARLGDATQDDIKRAIAKLDVLGFRIVNDSFVVSVPVELNADHTVVLELATETGYVTAAGLRENLDWKQDRVDAVLANLLKDGFAWVDGSSSYYFPSIWLDATLDR